MWLKFMVNLGKYTIHGAHGIQFASPKEKINNSKHDPANYQRASLQKPMHQRWKMHQFFNELKPTVEI